MSVMANLAMRAPWERLLMPAFIYFFKLLYPFALANGRRRFAHAAAGGCMLVRRDALDAVGGIASLRDAVIDDCALAKRLKAAGYRTWIGLSRAVTSTRRYPHLADTWSMVTRTAYTQLGYSWLALLACTGLMLISMVAPVLGVWVGPEPTRWVSLVALAAMTVSYLPTVRYYELPWPIVFTLPPVSTLYLVMTWASAWSAWRGVRARWKDRQYASVVTR
ncbi:MAG: glycosyltransferase [Pseudomonadota bacterium]